jgi:2-aminoadipate transaminase
MESADPVDTAVVLDVAVKHGVAFVPGAAFGVDADLSRSARLCFATYPETVLEDAAQKLGDAFRDASAQSRG